MRGRSLGVSPYPQHNMKLTRVLFVSAVPLALMFGSLSVHAQARDPNIERIWRLGMDSSQAQKLSQVLFDSLGPRLMGSPDLKRANDWLVATYKSWGIEAKNENYGTWRGWRRGPSHVDLISPRVRTLDATMVGYSPGTAAKDVVADVIVLPTFASGAEFKAWMPQAKGKLVLVNAPPVTCRPQSDWRENATPASLASMDSLRAAVNAAWGAGRGGGGRGGQDSAARAAAVADFDAFKSAVQKGNEAAIRAGLDKMIAAGGGVRGTGLGLALGGGTLGLALERAGAAGVLTTRPKDAWGTREIFETYNTIAPTLSLSCEDYGLVFRLAENKQTPKIRMNLDGQLLGEQPVFNTVAMIKGSTLPNEYVVMSAHFDSWDGSSGATDNGTGTITMLEAMRILKKVYPNPKRTIVVGHWSGEEEGEVGSKAFTEDHPEVIKGLQGVFNQDNGTGRVQSINPGGLGDGGNHLLRWLDQMPEVFRAQVNFNGGKGRPAGGGSDDYSFSCYVAPIFGLSARGWDYNTITWHTGHDTYDKVVFDDLKSNATMTAMLVYLASEDPAFINRDTSIVATMRDPDPAIQALREKLQPVQAPAAGGGRGGAGGGRGNAAGGRGAGAGRGNDSTAAAAAAGRGGGRGAGAGGGGRGAGGGGSPFPTCTKAPRVTDPRLR